MMRSMYSAVSGLKTHQTRMDVIGNNIANVNTVAFKSSSVTFSDILYQTTSNASGANATTGTGGVNAKQIGLGTTAAATKVSITSAGASETTGNPFDIRLTDKNSTNFFIVNNGSENVFTRSGSFYVDGSGNLCMSSTGYTVMGWQVDETTGEIRKDTVSALRIMQEKNLTSAPEATTQATIAGVLDENDADVKSDAGKVMNLNFYDNLGYQYTAKFAIKATGTDGEYTVELTSILDSNNKNITEGFTQAQMKEIFGNTDTETTIASYSTTLPNCGYTYDTKTGKLTEQATGVEVTIDGDGKILKNGVDTTKTIKDVFGVSDGNLKNIQNSKAAGNTDYVFKDVPTTVNGVTTHSYQIVKKSATNLLKFNTEDGKFSSIGGGTDKSVELNLNNANLNKNGNFQNITVDFSQCLNYNKSGKSTIGADAGAVDGTTGKGRKLGAMTGIYIDTNGRIYGTYDNGNKELLGQIAVAQFSNASGLEKVGESCYRTTLNSGEFDGIGVEISADGSSMTTGELEMSNVDLSSEFTSMITTQRGFQANSRVITTSDTLLEELVNLKR
ncbi:flagellar hook protein FlgE [Roseburia inulinivorans]|uniref:Flagellar hook protein FlgE n=1 Tax=Roseburia inulinivorans TaxID=360807 RepID=A0A173X9V2_9FIRM|nr:flagellar hook-basal body complex protein [Roseburia inulinivorans]CUN48060.1 Flagellar hook protein flgE [Roseburia inulinivorans]